MIINTDVIPVTCFVEDGEVEVSLDDRHRSQGCLHFFHADAHDGRYPAWLICELPTRLFSRFAAISLFDKSFGSVWADQLMRPRSLPPKDLVDAFEGFIEITPGGPEISLTILGFYFVEAMSGNWPETQLSRDLATAFLLRRAPAP